MKRTVLIVEDSQEMARILVEMVEGLGWTAVLATRTEDAVNLLHSGRKFDVVLLDFMMPDTVDMETVTRVSWAAPARTPIVSVSATVNRQLVINAIRRGIAAVLDKGNLSPATMLDAVERAMARMEGWKERCSLEVHAALLARERGEHPPTLQ